MVAGHLQEKNGIYYMVLSYPDASGKRKSKWISTKLPAKGNKKKAEKMLAELRQTFEPEEKPMDGDHKAHISLDDLRIVFKYGSTRDYTLLQGAEYCAG